MASTRSKKGKHTRINLRATGNQQKLIRTGAQSRGVSVTQFILESACLQAEHVLAERREFVVSASQWKEFVAALERPAQVKPELVRLLANSSDAKRKSTP
jgi:uncharacterized protein (DUF1778 family)